jgi:beta-lactamase regulating signal transducer with metallopeptidase domain
MQPLLHSPFLQALGYSIINSLWQFAFLWLLYYAINTIFKLSSHQKYTAGLVLEITGFTWFLITLVFYYNQTLLLPQNLQNTPIHLAGLFTNSATTFKQQFFLLILKTEQFFPYLSIAYLALLFILAVRWIYAFRFTQKVRVSGLNEIEDEWKNFVQKISAQLGIKKTVDIYLSKLVETPLTVGFFKPLILIPLATINYLNVQQMEAVILHELAHIKRFDYLFNLVLAFIEACLFFNPFMQLIHHQVKKERENCCDDWVLRYDYSAASYARALLQIATNQTHNPLLTLNATDNKKLLITRIKRIIEKNEKTFFNHKHQLLALLVLTTVFILLSFLSPSKKADRASKVSAQTNVVFEPIAAKVSNPLFNPVFFLANNSKTIVETHKKAGETKIVKAKIKVHSLDVPPPQEIGPEPELFDPVVENQHMPGATVRTKPVSNVRSVTLANSLIFSSDLQSKEAEQRVAEEKIERWFSKEASKQIEIVESHLKKLQSDASKERDGALNLEKVRVQLKSALDQIKSSKKQVELTKLQTLVRTGIKKIRRERTTTLLPDMNVFKLNELELLDKQIEREMGSLDQLTFYTAHLNADVNYNFQLPNMVYSTPKEKAHNFSFQFSTTKPRVRVLTTTREKEANCPQQKKIVVVNGEDEMQQFEIAPAPPTHTTRLRSVYIIKI